MSNKFLISAFTSCLFLSFSTSAEVCQHEIAPTEAYKEAVFFYPCDISVELPAITLTGGYSNTYRNMQWLADAVVEQGYVVLAMTPPDIYGKVEGWRDAHLEGQKTLVSTATAEQSPLSGYIDTSRRGIAGFSMGGGGTLLAGTELGDEVKVLAAFAPFLLEEQRAVSPTAPTMILAGARDLLVTNESIEQIYAGVSASADNHFLAVYSDGRHQQWYRPEITKNRDSYTRLTIAWLNRFLKADATSAITLNEEEKREPGFTSYQLTLEQ